MANSTKAKVRILERDKLTEVYPSVTCFPEELDMTLQYRDTEGATDPYIQITRRFRFVRTVKTEVLRPLMIIVHDRSYSISQVRWRGSNVDVTGVAEET